MEIFAGIDGTLSHGDMLFNLIKIESNIDLPGGNSTNSHVFDFYQRLNTCGGKKNYFEGPCLTGSNVTRIISDVVEYIKMELTVKPDARISLVGFSRGGVIAILAAKALTGIRKIHFLGLYDAADSVLSSRIKEAGKIENVLIARQAYRNELRSSHELFSIVEGRNLIERISSLMPFKNTGMTADLGVLEKAPFFASHAAIGGMIPPPKIRKEYKMMKDYYEDNDRIQGVEAHKWMIVMAQKAGLQIKGL